MRARIAWVPAVTTLALAWGCGGSIERLEAVPLDTLPPGLLKTAQDKLPDVNFDQARKARYDGQDAFEIRGKDKRGKIREVEVTPAGRILEIE